MRVTNIKKIDIELFHINNRLPNIFKKQAAILSIIFKPY
jgi:hypothetical protein